MTAAMKTDSWESTIEKYQGLLIGISHSILLDEDEAFDVSQEVWLKAMEVDEAKFFGDGFSQKAWLVKVARNLSLNRKRSLTRQFKKWIQAYQKDVTEFQSCRLEWAEKERAVREVLMRLDEDSRQILALRYYAQLSYDDISVELGIAKGTVMSRLSRAKEKFKTLSLEGGEHEEVFS